MKTKKVLVSLPISVYSEIEQFQGKNSHLSMTACVIELILKGLKSERKENA